MFPQLEIGGFSIRSYLFFGLISIVIGLSSFTYLLRKRKLCTWKQVLILDLSLLFSFLLGARFFNGLVNLRNIDFLAHLLTPRFTYFSVYGGILATCLFLFLWTFLSKVDLFVLLDQASWSFYLAFFFARIGCYANGCCGGHASNSCLAVNFPSKSSSFLFNLFHQARLPTQIFELVGAILVLLLVSLYLRFALPFAGQAFLLLATGFSLLRLIILPFRRLVYGDLVVQYLYPALYLTLILLSLGIWLHKRKQISQM